MSVFLNRYKKQKSNYQKGGNQISALGYKRNSPYKNEEYLYIETPNGMITMKDVDFPILGISNVGEAKLMYPEKEYQYKGKIIKEIPLKAMGGACIKRRTKFSSGGTINGKSPQDYLDKVNKDNALGNSIVTGGAMVGSTIADAILPGSGKIVGGAVKLVGSGLNYLRNLRHKKDIEKAKKIISTNQLETVGRDYENKMKDTLGYV